MVFLRPNLFKLQRAYDLRCVYTICWVWVLDFAYILPYHNLTNAPLEYLFLSFLSHDDELPRALPRGAFFLFRTEFRPLARYCLRAQVVLSLQAASQRDHPLVCPPCSHQSR